MKKLLKLMLCVAVAAIVFVGYSCSKDDTSDTTPYSFSFGGHSYTVVKEAKTWADAAAYAKSKGGYLVEIGSQAEQDAVYKGIRDAGVSATYRKVADGGGVAYVWIGATDRGTEGQWKWDGTNSGTGELFWTGSNSGSAVGDSYVNWGGTAAGSLNEPDNFTDSGVSPNGQDAAAIGLAKWPAGASIELGRAGEWNDIAETNKLYFVVEFDEE